MPRPGSLERLYFPGTMVAATPEATGTWTNVTPAAANLPEGTDAYGFGVVESHLSTAGLFYAYNDRDGCWRSRDAGLTWAKVSPPGDPGMDGGKLWGGGIFASGRLIAASGNNANDPPGPSTEYKFTVQSSDDEGATWTASAMTGINVYGFSVNRSNDPLHAMATGHDEEELIETLNGGTTWASAGTATGVGFSAYVLLLNATTAVLISQDTGGLYRGTKSGSTWTWTLIEADIVHSHGVSQPYYDVANGLIFMPHTGGILKSSDGGQSWTSVYSVRGLDCIWATPTKLYAGRSAPFNGGSFSPEIVSADRPAGTSWSSSTNPAGMNNGPRMAAVTTNPAGQTVVVTSNWLLGLWRWVEP